MRKYIFAVFISFLANTTTAQEYIIKGKITDAEKGNVLANCKVQILPSRSSLTTGKDGLYQFDKIQKGLIKITANSLGYEKYETEIYLKNDSVINIFLHPLNIALEEVIVESKQTEKNKIENSLPQKVVSKYFLLQNTNLNFVKTLSNIPGINSMDIGSGFSKPVIRGLGFNRLAVVDKNIIQQNQQWGADHGIEIDQYDVDNAVVHKGPMSLTFGSDAMGGLIEIKNPNIPANNGFSGDAMLTMKSNNQSMGVAGLFRYKNDKWFYRMSLLYRLCRLQNSNRYNQLFIMENATLQSTGKKYRRQQKRSVFFYELSG